MKVICIICAAFLIVSCGKSKKDLEQDESNARLSALKSKYNPIVDWDLGEPFTYTYQEKFVGSPRPLLFEGEISDIVKVPSGYLVSIESTLNDETRVCIARINLDEEAFKSFETERKREDKTHGSFVIIVNSITSSNPKLEYESGDDGNGGYTYLDNSSRIMILNATLVAYYFHN